MARAHRALVCLIAILVSCASGSGVASKSFTIANNCEYTVWPGILSSAGSAGMDSTGFALAPGESRAMSVPSGWSGRLWGRTLCSTDGSTGKFTCVTGDCGSDKQECAGGGAAPPATLAEFTMDGSGGMDFYDVSLVDGYNLPVLVAPQGATAGGNCAPTGCMVDLNGACPADLRVASNASGVACKSACEAFGSAQYCCNGEYGNPSTCKPSAYSQFFKNACPRAYSYAYDDATSTFTCAGGDTTYAITFCPSTTSVKSAGSSPQAPGGLPLINGTMVYLGGDQFGAAADPPPERRPRRRLTRARGRFLLSRGGALRCTARRRWRRAATLPMHTEQGRSGRATCQHAGAGHTTNSEIDEIRPWVGETDDAKARTGT